MVSQSALALRPQAVLEGLTLRFREYPVALMNRRVWPLNGPDVVNRRDSAGGPNWNDPRSFPDSLSCYEGVFDIE